MKKLFSYLAIPLLLSGFANQSFAQVSNDNEDEVIKIGKHSQGDFREGELLVKIKTSSSVNAKSLFAKTASSASQISKVFEKIGVSQVDELMPLTNQKVSKAKSLSGSSSTQEDVKIFKVKYDATSTYNVGDAIALLNELDDVEFAEPNYIVYSNGQLDDWDIPAISDQLWGLKAINMPQLWNVSVAGKKRPVIAILDTGVDISHPDLAQNIWTNTMESEGAKNRDDDGNGFKDDIHGWDFVNQTGVIGDYNGHGTHCAGIAAAIGGNGVGIIGANPDAYIMPVTVMQSDGMGDVATIIKGIDYASANGAEVISMSFGTYSESSALKDALGRAYTNSVLVAAAGNDGYCLNHAHPGQSKPMPMFPAAYPFVLGVQASQAGGSLAGFSNYDDNGPFFSAWGEHELYNYELKAPGAGILSCFPGGKYKSLNGTSMSCPLVAGAISRLLQVKEYTNKEMLFGDLINSANSNGVIDIYTAYNIEAANRKPSLSFVSYDIDDNSSILSTNDNDGRVDAGELIDIYPTVRNAWGHAKNIKLSIALAENEQEDIVTVINDNVVFGNPLDGYAKMKSASPLRIKINKDCADGRRIKLVLSAICDGTAEIFSQDITLTAENGVEIGGIIAEDTTLPEGTYIVTKPLAVPAGVTLTIEPGAILKFKDGTGLSVNYVRKSATIHFENSNLITHVLDREKSGRLIMSGTPEKKIILTCADGESGDWKLNFGVNNTSDIYYTINDDSSYDAYSYLEVSGLRGKNSDVLGGFFFNCVFYDNNLEKIRYAYHENCIVHNSDVTQFYNDIFNLTNISNITCLGSGSNFTVDFSIFHSCNILSIQDKQGDKYSLIKNSILPEVWKTDYPSYLGSAKESIVRKSVWDIENNYGFGYFDLSNMLTEPSPEAHGIVWKVLVNGTDAQDEYEDLSPIGVGRHRFDVYFNRPMDKTIAPTIAMGVREPYTQTAIAENGKWNSNGTVYSAYLTLKGKNNIDGVNRIYVAGAKDLEGFEIPTENYRFNVPVNVAGTMSDEFMAEAGLGKVNLSWEKDVLNINFDDMLGYNIYRYSLDANNNMTDEKRLNTQLVDADDDSFTDYDVIPGTTYCYYYKVLRTDLSETDASKIVAATPATASLGDANGSGSVDVMDVQTTVNYAAGMKPKPFIYEAADVNVDNNIDILDIIGIIKIVMNGETTAAKNALASNVSDQTAILTIENGVLYIETPVKLAGVQVQLATDDDATITVAEGTNGMEQATAWLTDNDYLFLAYSIAGKTLAPGKHALLNVANSKVNNIVIADENGKAVNVVSNEVTAIDRLASDVKNVKGVYTLQGVKLSGKENKELPKGIYIINGEKVIK